MQRLPDGEYYIYLRKSRADIEAEARGEGETLSRHRNELFRLAKQYNVNITEVFEEIVSGESLYHRSEMLRMLKMIEERKPKGVLCMDMDRLGRGNMQEQGLILETFRKSGTKIITPRKIYDLNDEFDEEYSEFEAFMARKELKIINRRLQGGRIRSVKEGNYIGTRPPYGYSIEKNDRGDRYLVPNPDQAPYVKMIFELYTHPDPEKRMGSNKIADELNKVGAKTYTGKPWEASSVLNIIKNAVYIGRIQWRKVESKKSREPGKRRVSRTRPVEEWIDVEGKHEPLISKEIYYKAQEILKRKYHVPYHLENGITNPLAGLIRCGKCGMSMVLRPYTNQPPHLMCYNRTRCDNKSSRFEFVEEKLIASLEDFLRDYKAQWERHKKAEVIDFSLKAKESALKSLERELEELNLQKGNLHDLLEKNVYTVEIYLERSQILASRIEETTEKIKTIQSEIEIEKQREKAQKNIIPKIESILELYHRTDDPKKKNDLLKSVLSHAVYKKEKHQRLDNFELKLYPKLHSK